MDHPIVYPGHLYPADNRVFHSMGLYDKRSVNGETVMGRFMLTEDILRREKLMQMSVMLFPRDKKYKSEAKASVKELLSAVKLRKSTNKFFPRHPKYCIQWR